MWGLSIAIIARQLIIIRICTYLCQTLNIALQIILSEKCEWKWKRNKKRT